VDLAYCDVGFVSQRPPARPDLLRILYEDPHLLAVDKPAGLLTQAASSGEPTLEDAVRRHLDPSGTGAAYLGTVHRLDRPVSGVILWAKTPKAARRLAEQFAGRDARKEYWAVVEGEPPGAEGTWEDWLCLDDTGLGVVQVCSRHAPRARRALTRFRAGAGGTVPTGCSWFRLWPETGRTHQLRVQAASRGRPILGDRAYGASRAFEGDGIALHARALTIRHPITQAELTLAAPTPAAWARQGIDLTQNLI
jgi:23S rRNA pseudouridine1911/1915/1917 synthase